MFEILSVVILYTRATLDAKLHLLFKLYCFDGDSHMRVDEFQFMMDKISTSIGSTLQLKKTLLLEVVTHYNFFGDNSQYFGEKFKIGGGDGSKKQSDGTKTTSAKDKMTVEEFATFMRPAFSELSKILNNVTERISLMSLGL